MRFRVPHIEPVADRRMYSLKHKYRSRKLNILAGFRWPVGVEVAGDLVCLGDSVPFGQGVRDHETYPALLGALNAGVSSYNIRQSLARYEIDVLGRGYSPNVVTIQAANDVSLYMELGSTWTPHSVHLGRMGGAMPEGEHRAHTREWMLDSVRTHLEAFCDKHPRLRVLLISANLATQGCEPVWHDFNWVLKLVSVKHTNADYLDVRAAFGKREDVTSLFIDPIHMSPKGHEVMAEMIRGRLEEC